MDNMIVKTILAIALTSFSPAIVSANVCEPTSELYKVFGVESWDTLNVRSGPSTNMKLLMSLRQTKLEFWSQGIFSLRLIPVKQLVTPTTPTISIY